jgi:hypothetical protein
MLEFKTSFAEAPHVDTTVYRPLSGLAVASVALAGLYAVVILILGGLALYFGDPLPLGILSLIVPVTALGLGLIARMQIANSEGTRSGLALANWGCWLSLLVGLGYGAIYAGTYLALTWQVRSFGTEFFDLMRQGKINHAFLLTLDPEVRASANPDNPRMMIMRFGVGGGKTKAQLPAFQQAELTRILQQGGPETVVRPLGINGWEYDKGYHFLQTYRVTTREGDFDVQLSLRSSEAGKARAWRVVWSESDINATKATLTEFGEALRRWRQDSLMFAQIWLQKRAAGIVMDQVYLDTLEPKDRNVWKSFHACRWLAEMAAWGGALANSGRDALWTTVALRHDPDSQWSGYLPGFQAFANGGVVNADKLDAPANYRKEIVDESKSLFRFAAVVTGRDNLKISDGNTGIPETYDPKTKRLRILHNVDFSGTALHPESPDTAQFRCEGQLVLESDPGDLTANRRVEWRVVSLNLLTGGEPPPPDPMEQRRGGGARRPRMPQALQLPNPTEKK